MYYNIVKLLIYELKVRKWDQEIVDEQAKLQPVLRRGARAGYRRGAVDIARSARAPDRPQEVQGPLRGTARDRDEPLNRATEGLGGVWGRAPRDPGAAGSLEGLRAYRAGSVTGACHRCPRALGIGVLRCP